MISTADDLHGSLSERVEYNRSRDKKSQSSSPNTTFALIHTYMRRVCQLPRGKGSCCRQRLHNAPVLPGKKEHYAPSDCAVQWPLGKLPRSTHVIAARQRREYRGRRNQKKPWSDFSDSVIATRDRCTHRRCALMKPLRSSTCAESEEI